MNEQKTIKKNPYEKIIGPFVKINLAGFSLTISL